MSLSEQVTGWSCHHWMEKTARGVICLGRKNKGLLGWVTSSKPVIHLKEDVGQFNVGIWCLEKRSGLKVGIWELLPYREYSFIY